ncbi:hypothetical protein PKHYL_35300 [Psychrobacter sp. KH172YL61]|uniref:Uncharacterized protein n=1 Tax=Psychrobacter pacificensis TaxID=112002 RepID=A0ABQ5YX34_9GAMM|nr:hypothetical protein PKHYL_35300 [Psychrobacter sp. KH172YL61]GLR29240.1 hypothetical protein GCM10007915_14780 [Psychrobacter pacificensis]
MLASNGSATDGWFGRGDCGAVMNSPLLSENKCYLKINIWRYYNETYLKIKATSFKAGLMRQTSIPFIGNLRDDALI